MGRNGRYRAVMGGTAVCVVAIAVMGATYRLLPPVTAFDRRDVHAEYVKYLSGKDTITGYLAYPERKDPAPAVVVIHEIFGMSDFVRQTTEQLARDGFVALAPDLLSRRGGTPPSTDDARKLIAGLNPDTLTLDLDATVAYLNTLKAVRSDRIGVIGFCWGGGQSFRYATNNPALRAYVVCYGPAPDAAAIARIHAKGLGVYAENDARIDAGLADVAAAVKQYAKDYRYTVYPGVGHGFLRAREKPEVADSAWRTVVRFFRESLEH
jgi:carboxymethylenebutenolidase